MRALLAIVLAAVACSLPAQIETPDEPTVFADFGFANVMPTGCWAPITVAVQAIDEPLSGYVELSYVAGGEQISHVAPFAVAAQSNALIPMTVHLPWWTETISVAAFDERQGRVAQLDYRSNPGPTDARLPTLSRPEGIVLSVTHRLPAGVATEALQPSEGAQTRKPQRIAAVNITPDRLPPSHLAYGGVDLLIIEPALFQGADPRAVEAILRYAASGGRLLLITDRPGSDHTRWLNATPATASIDVGTITTTETGTIRPLVVSSIATAAGWSVTASDQAGNALAAQGPFAFGWMGILGIDPLIEKADQPLRQLLAAATTNPADATDDLAANIEGPRNDWYDPFTGRSSDQLLYRYIDAVARSDPPGSGGFILIAAVPLTLALLLGPFDFFMLGLLRRRPLAWFSALIWIAAVGTVALTVPRLFQKGTADIGTVAATDLILPNLAMPLSINENAAAAVPGHLAGWSAEATLLFHASQTPFELQSESPAAWRPFESGRGDAVALTGMTFRQTPTGPGPNAAAGIEPVRIPSRIWSMVTLHAEGPSVPTFAVALSTAGNRLAARLTAQFTGLPEDARVIAARVLHDDQAFTLITPTPAKSTADFSFALADTATSAFDPGNAADKAYAAFAVLTGEPARRNASINALQRAGWARVDLLVENPLASATFITADESTQTRFAHYRILTPMPSSPSEATP